MGSRGRGGVGSSCSRSAAGESAQPPGGWETSPRGWLVWSRQLPGSADAVTRRGCQRVAVPDAAPTCRLPQAWLCRAPAARPSDTGSVRSPRVGAPSRPRRHVPTPPQDTLSFCPPVAAPRAPGHRGRGLPGPGEPRRTGSIPSPPHRLPAARASLTGAAAHPKTSPAASQIPRSGADRRFRSMSSAKPRRPKPLPQSPTPASGGAAGRCRGPGPGDPKRTEGGER